MTTSCYVPWCTWDHSDGLAGHSAQLGVWKLGTVAAFQLFIAQMPPNPPAFTITRYQERRAPRVWKLNCAQAADIADLLDLFELLDGDTSRDFAAALRRAAATLAGPFGPRLGR
ncbi:hypothetical protein [Nonomuraea insulae]|uniref:Uncharacterized protein n=1 Tax=Nonomuraea insulae TaxID=1616787 RepID=A0ABW1DC87_9ACTN